MIVYSLDRSCSLVDGRILELEPFDSGGDADLQTHIAELFPAGADLGSEGLIRSAGQHGEQDMVVDDDHARSG